MKSAKSLLASSGAVDIWIAATADKTRILMYHGVSPHNLSPEQFDRHLEYIGDRFDCYWAREIPGVLEKRTETRKPAIVLTFDDGLRNNLTYAVPLLRRHGLKATFFVVTDLLENGQGMLWNHEILCRLLLADRQSLPSEIGTLSADRSARYRESRRLIEAMKGWENDRRIELLRMLRMQEPQPAYEPWMREKYEIMNRKEVTALPDNIEVGSHTRTHPILPTIDENVAQDEIEGSRQILEDLVGRPVESFCYPDGQFSDRDENIVRRNYEVAVTVEEGLVDRRNGRHRLPRIPAAHNMLDFAIRMVRPGAGDAAPDAFDTIAQPREDAL